MKTIYFFAKVGNILEKPYGGGEMGNRRTMDMFNELGYNVHLIPRYCNYQKKKWHVYLKMIIGDMFSVLRLFFTLLFKRRQDACVHISGFTGAYMVLEVVSVGISKMLGYNTIYEIRGGGIVGFYDNGSIIYRWMFREAVILANHIWSQGYENIDLIKSISDSSFFHYPNCVKEDFMPKSCPVKSQSEINLVFLGRICPMKNVLLVIETTKLLSDIFRNVKLDIIGDGVDFPDYEEMCKQKVGEYNLQDKCYFHGKLDKSEMIPVLKNAHFFLFPSEEPREGQSNSLTETMSFGIVPIASSQGYTRTIVDNDYLIEDSLNSQAYFEKIVSIINNNKISEYSNNMYTRVLNNFTYSSILSNVSEEYKMIFRSK